MKKINKRWIIIIICLTLGMLSFSMYFVFASKEGNSIFKEENNVLSVVNSK